MDNKRYALLLAPFALAAAAWPDAAARLSVEAEPAVASVQHLPEGRGLVSLPPLEFEFGILASCGPDRTATSVSISVADTRTTLAGEQIRTGSPIVTALRLPARQLSPVAVDGFCRKTTNDAGADRVLIEDAVTAHVSLRCAGDAGQSITYSSESLDVVLVCEPLPDDQGDASTATER